MSWLTNCKTPLTLNILTRFREVLPQRDFGDYFGEVVKLWRWHFSFNWVLSPWLLPAPWSRLPGLVWVQIGHTSTHLLSGIVENSSLKCWHKRCFLLFEVKTFKDTQYLLNIKFKSLHDGPLTINYWHWLHSLQLSEVLICDPSVTWSCCMRIMSRHSHRQCWWWLHSSAEAILPWL